MDNKNELWYTQRTGWMKCKSRESDGKDHYLKLPIPVGVLNLEKSIL